jgi:hypothetical protein
MRGVKRAGAMKTLCGTFVSKLGILAVAAIALIVLISASKKSLVLPTKDRPILVVFGGVGVRTTKPPGDIQKACRELNKKAGKTVCEIAYYDKGREVFHEGSLTMTRAERSEAAEDTPPADQVADDNFMQKSAFTTLDEAADFLGQVK